MIAHHLVIANHLPPHSTRYLGSDEQRLEWHRCLSEGPTILEAREMRYKDLCALLSISRRQVLLSKKQVNREEWGREGEREERKRVGADLLSFVIMTGHRAARA